MYVWDRFVRLFHWSLLFFVITCLFTHGGLLLFHRIAGYSVAVLVIARVIWGFVGSPYARFSNFACSPSRVAIYLAQMLRRNEPRTLGHNPAGAAMIFVMFIVLIGLTVTGVALDSTTYRDYRPLHVWHDLLSDALLVLALLHLLGVAYTSFSHRENLLWAMITGRKRE